MSLARYAIMDGEVVPWHEARVHVFTPAFKYGSNVFEGLRAYWNEDEEELYVFRLAEHMERLEFSQRMMRLDRIIDGDHVASKVLELLRANETRETVHIRPTIFIGGDGDTTAQGPIHLAITAVARPLPERVHAGCSAQISNWERINDRAMPLRIKAGTNYGNSRYGAVQAKIDGYDTALFLNRNGKISEGPGMCFFMIRDGVPITPSVTSDILESITRDTVLELLRDRMGLSPVEREVDRSELGAAEEAFFCGTGWEITPINSIDRLDIGAGEPGPLTRRLQALYFDIVHGRDSEYGHWCTRVWGG